MLNYLVRRKGRKRERVVAFFVDLRSVFNSDRARLLEVMREKGIREGLVKRCCNLYKETKNKVRVKRKQRVLDR